ncbi:MAG: helix-turn-helix domain-containing protein [Anaerolineae bacterium]|nr:helix-turn-helix domain-containing protein [Anaerolineae bacterium]
MLADMQPIARVSPGYLLRLYRENSGMTQKGLASAAFCSVMMIRKIESGIRRPSHHLAHKLADALKVAPTHRAEFVRLLRSLPELPNLSQPTAAENPEQPEK